MRKRDKPTNRYELLTCALKGHALVGHGAANVTADDALVVREIGGIRWHRCLRCDDWVMREPPVTPTRNSVEARDEIDVPARGPVLRDRYVLRLIAFDRFTHVVVLTALAVVLFTFAGHTGTLHRDYNDIMNDLSGGDPGASQVRGVWVSSGGPSSIRPPICTSWDW